MDTQQMTAMQIIDEYHNDIIKLSSYLTWLYEKSGKRVVQIYKQEGIAAHSLSFPVYDSNLLHFVNDASQTKFMDKNYSYVYSRLRMKNADDEMEQIHKATILQMNILGGILSKYVLGGRTKASLWNEGLENGVFMELVEKAKELYEFWKTQEANE